MSERTLPRTPRAERTLARAEAIARERGHDYLGTEHLLLALLDDPDGIGGGSLHRLGFAEAIRNELVRILESEGYSKRR